MSASSSRALLRRIGGALLRCSFSASASAGSDSAAAAGYHVAGGPSYMRGAVFWEPGCLLTLEEFQMPRPKAGELLIKTKGPAFFFIETKESYSIAVALFQPSVLDALARFSSDSNPELEFPSASCWLGVHESELT